MFSNNKALHRFEILGLDYGGSEIVMVKIDGGYVNKPFMIFLLVSTLVKSKSYLARLKYAQAPKAKI